MSASSSTENREPESVRPGDTLSRRLNAPLREVREAIFWLLQERGPATIATALDHLREAERLLLARTEERPLDETAEKSAKE